MVSYNKRGPKIGDSSSLWNFTTAPGWTKDQVAVLRTALRALGVGKWVQILETGLLPGKVIQQLNGQTQRLLGQQSLAKYTGLCVDVDRVREDNLKRKNVQRKNGLIINTGLNPTQAQRNEWQKDAKEKYGLTAEQIRQSKEDLALLKHEQEEEQITILHRRVTEDIAAMDREQVRTFLPKVRDHALALQARLDACGPANDVGVPARSPSPVKKGPRKARSPRKAKLGSLTGMGATSQGNKRKARGGGSARHEITLADKTNKTAGKKKPRSASKFFAPCGGRPGKKGKANAAETPDDTDPVTKIEAMGFTRKQAMDALEESNNVYLVAVNWLMENTA